MILHVPDEEREFEQWREGVLTRMYVSAQTGARQLTVFEQWCEPGRGAPEHIHAVEEVLRVLSGEALIRVGDEERTVCAGESVIVPAGAPHGFKNTGEGTLHTQAILAAPIFEVRYLESGREDRRWGGS